MKNGADHFPQDPTGGARDDVQTQIDLIHSQMALYARDLKRMVDAEQQKTLALAEANARLAILDRLKTDFLAFIAHELRTPLSGMVVLDLLDPHDDPQSLAGMIDILRRGYERLEGFVEKGLEYFKWMATEPSMHQTVISDVAAITQATLASLPELHAQEVRLESDISPEPCLVRGEAEHLARVVEILLSNALKFSEKEKWVQVRVGIENRRVWVRVADHGRGFAPEMGSELLHPFTIAHIMNHSQGTGLSLALANAIIVAHGGHMSATSAGVGHGATFTVELPAVSIL